MSREPSLWVRNPVFVGKPVRLMTYPILCSVSLSVLRPGVTSLRTNLKNGSCHCLLSACTALSTSPSLMTSPNINKMSYDLPIHHQDILWPPQTPTGHLMTSLYITGHLMTSHTSTRCLMTSPYINRMFYNLQKHPHAVLWPPQISAGCLMTLLNIKRKWAQNSMGLQWEIIY